MEEAKQVSKIVVKKIAVKKIKAVSKKVKSKKVGSKIGNKTKSKTKSKVNLVKISRKEPLLEVEQSSIENFIETIAKSKQDSEEKPKSIIFNKEISEDKVISHHLKSQENDKQENKPINIYKKIAVSFIFLTVLLVVIIFYFSFVKVSIVLIPNQEDVSNNLTLDVYDQQKNPVLNSSVILGVVKQIEVEESKTYQASSKEVLGQEVIGKVTIFNNYNKTQPLIATTRLLSSDNKLFRIKNTVVAPAGGQVEAEIYADEPSREMVIGPSKFTIPGLWAGVQDKIYGQSNTAMEYKEKTKTTIQQSDIDQAVSNLKSVLAVKIKEQVNNDFKDYNQAVYKIDDNSIAQQLDSKIGDEKDKFTLSIKTAVTIVAFADEKVFQLAKQKLASTLPDDKELVDFSKKDIAYNLNSFDLKQGTAIIDTFFTGKMILKKNAEIIDRSKLLGLTNEQLNQYLGSIPEIAGYEIKYHPSFIKKVPNLIDRIKVEIKD